jgi:hypothetical protein
LPLLADAFHRIYEIEIKPQGNDLVDVRDIAEELNIEIIIYGINRQILYSQRRSDSGAQRCSEAKDVAEEDDAVAAAAKSITVYLLLDNNHFDPIVKISAFVVKEEITRCKFCNANGEYIKNTAKIICSTCNKSYFNKDCYANHVTSNRCIKYTYKCDKCFKIIQQRERPKDLHKCGEYYCGCCKRFVDKPHQCYMQRKSLNPTSEKYVFYDFETTVNDNNQQVVNYAVAQYFNGQEFVFRSIDEICSWLFDKTKHKYHTCIAHHAKGFAVQFIVSWLVSGDIRPNIINVGNKILQLEVKDDYSIRFIDSLSFTLIPLRDFPKTFGINELKNGYFPYKFNTTDNWNYIGEYRDPGYYSVETTKKKDRDEFMTWYDSVKHETFNFQQQMYEYCKSDVDILRQGCIIFRQLFLDVANIDPFQYITIASVCFAIYRNECLPQSTLALVEENPTDVFSVKSIKWLKYLSLKHNINIKNCKVLLKKVVIGRAVTALKQQKSKGKGEEKGIAEIVHLMKPITRSPDSSSSSSSSCNNNKNNNKNNNNLTFHPRCCLPGLAASGSGVGKKPLRSPRSGDQGERGPRLPARYGSVPINDVRSNAAGSLSSLIFDKHGFQVYLQFNNTTAAYLQCCRLPMLQPSKWLPTAASQVAPNGNAAAYTAGCQHVVIPHCKWLPTAILQPSKWLPTAMLQPLAMLRCCSLQLYAAGCQPWQYRTASGSLRQCCSL